MSETEAVVEQLARLGIIARVHAGRTQDPGRPAVTLTRGASTRTVELITGPAVRLSTLGSGDRGAAALVHTPYVGRRSEDAFRRAGINYVDDAGNAWIEFGDVLIDVRGRQRAGRPSSRPAEGNLFSSGRSQVVAALLAWPFLWRDPLRNLAEAAGVSLGLAHNTVTMLRQSGFEAGERLPGRAGLLDLWTAAYPGGLARRLTLAVFRGEIGPVINPDAADVVALSGEAAVPELLRPASLAVYVTALDPRLPIVNRWRTDGEHNITVYRRFWSTPGVTQEPETAPWPLVYADLLATGDPRARHAAEELRSMHE